MLVVHITSIWSSRVGSSLTQKENIVLLMYSVICRTCLADQEARRDFNKKHKQWPTDQFLIINFLWFKFTLQKWLCHKTCVCGTHNPQWHCFFKCPWQMFPFAALGVAAPVFRIGRALLARVSVSVKNNPKLEVCKTKRILINTHCNLSWESDRRVIYMTIPWPSGIRACHICSLYIVYSVPLVVFEKLIM